MFLFVFNLLVSVSTAKSHRKSIHYILYTLITLKKKKEIKVYILK